MERRAFLKSTCKLCVLGTAGIILPQALTSCGNMRSISVTIPIENGKIAVPLSLFENEPIQLIRPKGRMYNIAVIKTNNGFDAILMKCTHMDNQLYPTADGFRCNMHGSEFNKQGKMTKGPAEKNLTTYTTASSENAVIITI